METQALEILNGINKPVVPDATSVSIKDSTPIPGEKPEESSRFNAMEKAGVLQAAGVLLATALGKKAKKQAGVNVFSGFDGASGAQTGLRKAGVPINKYYASEIDKNAIGFTQHNYPETIQLGDIRDIDVSKLEPMDYGFFGFPCQSLSSANHNGKIGLRDMTTGKVLATLDDYEAAKAAGHELSSSSLFYEALKQAIALKKVNPNIRLTFENVASMKPEFRKIIDDNLKQYLGLDPAFEMNTKGPTNRKRVLWTDAITADDYYALSERMKQVMPEDIIDQKAHHNLSAKGAKDNQTDLFDDKGGEVSADGKFEPKTNAWLKGKLSTATASDGTGKLIKNGLEYDMTKKEMNRSQGNPDNLGLDYGISDRQFAKLIGNGWDQYQFKPLFSRAAMEAKGNIPKSEGRLGDENALKRINEKYQPEDEHKYIAPRLYHSRTQVPGESDLEPPASRWDVGTSRVYLQDIPSDPFRPAYPKDVVDRLERLINTAPSGLSRRELEQYLEANLSPTDMQWLERMLGHEYNNFRPGIWLATGKSRLGQYGNFNYRIDIPPREFERMFDEGMASVRPSHMDDAVINIFEPIPTSRITRAKSGDRSLGDVAASVDELNTTMVERLAKRWGIDTHTMQTLYDRKPFGMNISDWKRQVAELAPSEKAALFPNDPYVANQLTQRYPNAALRAAFEKVDTPSGTVPLRNATGVLWNELLELNVVDDPVATIRAVLADIANGLTTPEAFMREYPGLMKYYFKPLGIDLNALYE